MAAAEQKKSYQVIKQFKGVNTKANRTAIDDTEFSWLENAMPVGYANLKVTPTYSSLGVTFSHTIIHLTSGNIGGTDYLFAFENDGSAEYVNLTTNTKSTLASAGTFATTGGIVVSQWSNQYLMIGDPTKGYYLWDGSNLVSVGSVGAIGITSGGSGYTQPPTVTLSAPNQTGGVQATAICSVTTTAGQVTNIRVTAPGTGYTSVPKVTLSAPPAPGITATAVASTVSNTVVAISITNPGSGYTSAPSVTITGTGTNASATATIDTGSVNAIALTNAGTGYTSPPTVTFTGGNGSGASAVSQLVTFAKGTMTLLVTSGGSGYTSAPLVTISGGGGSNAAATAIISGGSVSQLIMTNAGTGYTNAANVTISFSATGESATATAKAVVTTDNTVGIASFSGRAWIAQGRTIYYSAAGSVSDFISISAGSISLQDSTLHGNITQIIPANNFLYVFGDDSINVLSDVRVTNAGNTIFTNTNISASVGSKRPYAIFPYFRSVLFLNDYGVYALVGSTTSKISDSLDGVFPYIDFTAPIYAGQVLLNNILCAAFTFKYNGPGGATTSARYIQAVFFEKKWFFTSQGNTLPYITTAPVSGKINLYGSDGTSCIRLYGDSSTSISSYIQTALMPMGDPIRTKQALKFGIEATSNTGNPITATVDSEYGPSPSISMNGFLVQWINNSNQIVAWQNNSSQTVAWTPASSAWWLYKADAPQWGKYLGLTVQSTTAGIVFNTFEFEHELRTRF